MAANPFDQFDDTANPFDQFDAAPAPAAAPQPQGFSAGRMVGNIPRSGMQLLGGVAQAIVHPIDTIYSLGEAGAGGIIKAVPESARGDLQFILGSPQAQQDLIAKANALGGFYADRYGGTDKILRTVEEDPVGVASDLSVIFGGAGAALKGAGATATGAQVGRVGAAIDPVLQSVNLASKASSVPFRAASAVGRPVSQFVFGPFRNPETAAANALAQAAGGSPQDIVNALRRTQGMQTTPGYTPTMAERTVAGGMRNPTVAAVQRGLATESDVVNRLVSAGEDVNVRALEQQLDRINTQIRQQQNALRPEALADLQRVQQDIQAQLASQGAFLEQATVTAPMRLPTPNLRAAGETITQRAGELRRETQATVIEPAYRKAFDAAGDAKIDVSGVINQSGDILRRVLSTAAPETAPNTAAALRRFQARATPGVAVKTDPATGMLISPEVAATPPVATLRELDEVRRAINSDLAAAKRSSAPMAATEYNNLMQMHSAIDDAVAGSKALSDEAKSLYTDAIGKYRTEFAPRFKTGDTARLFRQSSLGQAQLMPSRVALAYLGDADKATQFVTTFGKDAMAAGAMSDAISGLYRRAVEKGGSKAGDAFLTKYQSQLDALEKGGVSVRANLQAVGDDLRRIEAGKDALAARAKMLGHPDTDKLVTAMLGSQTRMREGLAALTGGGKDALVKELFDRAAREVDAGKPQAALDYLVKNETTLKQAAGARAYDDAVTSVKAELDAAEVAKNLPDRGNLENVVVSLKPGLSSADLTNLQLVADDLARRRDVEVLSGQGAGSPTPEPRRLATAGAEGGPPSLSIPISAAKEILKVLGKGANSRAAQQLAHWMYKDPDAAIAALEKVIAKKSSKVTAAVKAAPGVAKAVVTSPITRLGAQNQLAQQQNQNALAP